MHSHHLVALSCLWYFAKQYVDFVKCNHKHNDDQSDVKDVNARSVDILLCPVLQNRDQTGDVHAGNDS